jgi:hypothetical protein
MYSKIQQQNLAFCLNSFTIFQVVSDSFHIRVASFLYLVFRWHYKFALFSLDSVTLQIAYLGKSAASGVFGGCKCTTEVQLSFSLSSIVKEMLKIFDSWIPFSGIKSFRFSLVVVVSPLFVTSLPLKKECAANWFCWLVN